MGHLPFYGRAAKLTLRNLRRMRCEVLLNEITTTHHDHGWRRRQMTQRFLECVRRRQARRMCHCWTPGLEAFRQCHSQSAWNDCVARIPMLDCNRLARVAQTRDILQIEHP